MIDTFSEPVSRKPASGWLFAGFVVSAIGGLALFTVLPTHPPGYDLLMEAIDRKDPRQVRTVLASGVSPNAYPTSEADLLVEDDIAPLDTAARNGNAGVVEALLEYGADPNMGDGWNHNPLEAAGGHWDVATVLIEHGAKVNDDVLGSSALWRAAMEGKLEAVAFLLSHGANPNTHAWTSEPKPESLLHALKKAGWSDPRVVRMLRKAGAKE